jgi:hypothetical protein
MNTRSHFNAPFRLPGMNKTWSLIALYGALTALACSCSRGARGPLDFRDFNGQGPEYYSQVADTCSSLMTNLSSTTPGTLVMQPNDPRMPDIIRALRPEYVEVSPARVYITVGRSRPGYAIIWERVSNSDWRLSTVAENLQKDLYSRRLLPSNFGAWDGVQATNAPR